MAPMTLLLTPALLTFPTALMGGWYLLKWLRPRRSSFELGLHMVVLWFGAGLASMVVLGVCLGLEIGVVRVEAADPQEVPPEVLGGFGLHNSEVGSISYFINQRGYVCAEFELAEPAFLAWTQRCGWHIRRFHAEDESEYPWRVWNDDPDDDQAELLIDGITTPDGMYVIVKEGYVAGPENADLKHAPFQCQYDIAGNRLIYNGDRWPGS